MISGLSMHCVDAPRMAFKAADGSYWIDLHSGKPSPHHTESHIAIHVWERSPDVVQRAADAFNAVMDGATLVPVRVSRDAEHAASPAGRLAAEIEGGPGFPLVAELLDPTEARRAGNRDLAQALDGAAARELEPHL